MHFLVFVVGPMRLALDLDAVQRVYQAAQVSAVADSAPLLKGLINIRGDVLPVVSMRARLGLEDREVLPEDRFLVVKSPLRTLVLLVDNVLGVFDSRDTPVTRPDEVLPEVMDLLAGVASTRDGLVLIQDLDALCRPVRDALRHAEIST
ncbi:chemotaxis protein CheW [Fundidesulfovibrio butyratiphilus]